MSNILVVENDRSYRQSMVTILRVAGHVVLAERHGDRFMQQPAAIQRFHPQLAIINWRLRSRYTGDQVAARLRVVVPTAKLILMTGCANVEQLSPHVSSLFHGIITKPFHTTTLLRTIARHLKP